MSTTKMIRKRILITGVSGLLGNNLAFYLKDKYDILGLYNTHRVDIKGVTTKKADLTREKEICAAINEFDPAVIIHCAAVSDIDYCEANRELTYQVNVLGTRQLIDLVRDKSTRFVYISTDAIYDNANGKSLVEEDKINPSNYYGASKYGGEQEVLKKTNTLILRTNIFGWNIQDKFSIAEWVVHELSQGREIQGFKDVYFSSIYTFELAKILDEAIKKGITGIYNCGSRTSMSKYAFALKLADYFQLDKSLIRPILIADYGFKAERRKNLSLDVHKIERDLGYQCPTMEESIEKFYEDSQKDVPQQIKPKNPSAVYPKTDFISYGRQHIDDSDIQAVVEVLKSKNLTQGPKVREFEEVTARTVDARFAVAVNSGTSALHIACLAAGIGPGDEVITSPNTFVASANCIVYCGAKPVFVDIDSKTYNIAPSEIEKRINERTKAVIPVDFAGQSCDMETIQSIVCKHEKKYGHKISIIEDAAHALGSQYKGSQVGSCRYSDMAIMSFHPVKHITTAEGGAVLTNDGELCKRLKRFRSHGITSTPEEFTDKDNAYEPPTDAGESPVVRPWYYEQISLGYNYRMTDIQCALGASQLKKLPAFIQRRREIVQYYNEHFKGIPHVQTPYELPDCNSNFHLYVLRFDFKKIGISRSEFMMKLRQAGIQTQVHYIPIYKQPFYRERYESKSEDFPNTEAYYQQCFSIPLFPSMTDNDVEKVTNEIKNLLV